MNKEEIKRLILKEGLTITDVIDAIIELNGLIGVGLITLGDDLKEYCYNEINPYNAELLKEEKTIDFDYFERYKDDSNWNNSNTSFWTAPRNLRCKDDDDADGN